MKKYLFIFLISFFSLTVISCGDDKEEYSATGSTDDTTTDNTTTDNTTTDNTTTDNTTTDTTAPTVSSISPTDNQGGVSISDNISVTFSVAMDNSSVTTNTSNTTCSGSFQLSLDNFGGCVQMSSSPSSSNSDKTFTVDPSDNLSRGTTYKTRVTTGVKDSAGNTLGSEYETSSGFTTWSGTQQLGTSSGDTKTDGVTVDSSGNIYVTGYTSGGLDNNTNSGNTDIFLVKYNSSGVKQWTKQLGTSTSDAGTGVTVDSSGNIYVTGSTKGGLDGNSNTAGSSWDFFLVKYNSSGVKQWTEQYGNVAAEVLGVGGYYTDFGQGVTVDSSDNIYVTGTINYGGNDIFLVKFYDNGTKQWTKLLGTSSDDRVALGFGEIMDGVTVDSSDNIYVVGSTKGGMDNNTNSGGWDFFLVKFNSSGTKQWTQQLGTSSTDYGNAVAVDSSDNIYVTGTTAGGLDNNTHFGANDIFLVKYNSSGEKQWTQQLGGFFIGDSSGTIVYSHNDAGTGVTVDSSNNIYVTGSTSKVIVGSNTSYGGVDTVLVKYNSSGAKQWAKQLGTSGHDYGQGVTADSSGNIYVTGKTNGGLDGNTSSGSLDVFLVKYNSDGVKQ